MMKQLLNKSQFSNGIKKPSSLEGFLKCFHRHVLENRSDIEVEISASTLGFLLASLVDVLTVPAI